VEVLGVLVVLGVIGFVGWAVYIIQKEPNEIATSNAQQSSLAQASTTAPQEYASQGTMMTGLKKQLPKVFPVLSSSSITKDYDDMFITNQSGKNDQWFGLYSTSGFGVEVDRAAVDAQKTVQGTAQFMQQTLQKSGYVLKVPKAQFPEISTVHSSTGDANAGGEGLYMGSLGQCVYSIDNRGNIDHFSFSCVTSSAVSTASIALTLAPLIPAADVGDTTYIHPYVYWPQFKTSHYTYVYLGGTNNDHSWLFVNADRKWQYVGAEINTCGEHFETDFNRFNVAMQKLGLSDTDTNALKKNLNTCP
jgi:hypothetical protein